MLISIRLRLIPAQLSRSPDRLADYLDGGDDPVPMLSTEGCGTAWLRRRFRKKRDIFLFVIAGAKARNPAAMAIMQAL